MKNWFSRRSFSAWKTAVVSEPLSTQPFKTNKQTKSKSRYNTVGNRNGSWGKWSYPSEHRLCQTQTKSWIIQTNWLKLKSHFRHSSLSFQPAQTLFRWNIVRKESVCTLSSPKVTLADSSTPFYVCQQRGVLVA